eukprot:TRINITY_DN4852_c0_g1_i1.p1 TRINITY_DN4852_c0_g1~~TRINITY_DN4852_c0_g1_i1.p1  ORF type:complete len:172 (+),score=34.30 TRINITY_DN4852_c0_g1_i1:112-627(+)
MARRCVVVAVDGSPMSVNALHWTLQSLVHSGISDTELVLLYVQPFWTSENLNVLHGDSTSKVHDDSKSIMANHRECVDRSLLDRKIVTTGITVSEVVLCQNDSVEFSAGSAICEYVESLMDLVDVESCHLIVGSKEKGFFEKAFLGSVSEYCVKHAVCPVTVVKMVKSKNL